MDKARKNRNCKVGVASAVKMLHEAISVNFDGFYIRGHRNFSINLCTIVDSIPVLEWRFNGVMLSSYNSSISLSVPFTQKHAFTYLPDRSYKIPLPNRLLSSHQYPSYSITPLS